MCQTIFPLRLQTGMGERHKATSADISDLRASVQHRKSTRKAQGYVTLARLSTRTTTYPPSTNTQERAAKIRKLCATESGEKWKRRRDGNGATMSPDLDQSSCVSPLEKVIEQMCQTIFPLRLQTGMGERHKATSAGMVNLRASVPHQKSTRTAQGNVPLHG